MSGKKGMKYNIEDEREGLTIREFLNRLKEAHVPLDTRMVSYTSNLGMLERFAGFIHSPVRNQIEMVFNTLYHRTAPEASSGLAQEVRDMPRFSRPKRSELVLLEERFKEAPGD